MKLSDYTPDLANAKISVAALWECLEDLETMADDPVKVKKWIKKIHAQILKCRVC